jgi:hypothetical protein
LIDANTPVLSPLLTTNGNNLKPKIVRIESKHEAAIETADENLSTSIALVIMNPYEAKALMRFTASVYQNGLKRVKYESRKIRVPLRSLWFGNQMVQSEFVLIIVRLMNAR